MTAEASSARVHLSAREVGVISASVITVAALTYTWPLGRDQGIYAYSGWRLIEGDVPYRDLFLFKPPLTALTHALAQTLFGTSAVAIRILDGIIVLFAALGLASVARRHGRSAMLVGVSLSYAHFLLGYWHTAQTDLWAAYCLVGSLYLLTLHTRRSRLAAFVAGSFFAAAVLYKYTFLLALFPLAWLLRDKPKQALILFALGAAAPCLALGSWLATHDALQGFVQVLDYTINVHAPHRRFDSTWEEAWVLLIGLGTLGLLHIFPLLVVGTYQATKAAIRRDKTSVVELVWLVVALVVVAAQGKYFEYHYALLVPLAAWWSASMVPQRIELFVSVAAWGLTIAVTVFNTTAEGIDRYGYATRKADAAAACVAEVTTPFEPMACLSFDPAVAFLAKRRCATRWPYPLWAMTPSWNAKDAKHELQELIASRPKALVIGQADAAPAVTQSRAPTGASLMKQPGFTNWRSANYRKQACEGANGSYALYVRRH